MARHDVSLCAAPIAWQGIALRNNITSKSNVVCPLKCDYCVRRRNLIRKQTYYIFTLKGCEEKDTVNNYTLYLSLHQN